MTLLTNAAKLAVSAVKFRKQILQLPSIGVIDAVKHMTPRPGVTYQEVVGQIGATSELRPYDGNNNAAETVAMIERTLQTYLGSAVELFDPNAMRKTIWAQMKAHTDKIQNPDLNKAVLFAMADSIMSKLNAALFSATRNDSGTTTAELFNGFDIITATEIAAFKITAALGNYKTTDAITSSNALDILKAAYRAASDELQSIPTKLFLPYSAYNDYNDDYQLTVGAAPYNKEFKKTFLEGSSNLCELVPIVAKQGSTYLHLTTKSNMLYGFGSGVENESIEVRRGDNAFKLQFIMSMFFGVQFQTIDQKRLLVINPAGSISE